MDDDDLLSEIITINPIAIANFNTSHVKKHGLKQTLNSQLFSKVKERSSIRQISNQCYGWQVQFGSDGVNLY